MKKHLAILITILAVLTVSFLFSQETQREAAKLPEGYGDAKWGTSMDEVKSAIIGKITYTDDERIIITKDEHIEYRYGFFYKDPQKIAAEAPNNEPNNNPNNEETPDKILYYVSVRFPYLPVDEVRAKLEAEYGAVTIDNVSKNKGAIGWLGEKTLALIYVNEYENKQYVAKVTYVSTDIIKQVNDYENSVFNKTEIETIRRLAP